MKTVLCRKIPPVIKKGTVVVCLEDAREEKIWSRARVVKDVTTSHNEFGLPSFIMRGILICHKTDGYFQDRPVGDRPMQSVSWPWDTHMRIMREVP